VGVELNPGPGRGNKLEVEQRWEIVFEAKRTKGGKPNYTAIGRKVGCTNKSVKKVLKKYKETRTVEDLPRSGRKRKFSDKEAKVIVKKAKKGKFAPEIAHEIARESKKKAHVSTVKRVIRNAGIRYLRIKKKEKLTDAQKAKRVDYSKEMKGYKWNTVLFSDEKTFYLGASPKYAWQDPHNRLEEQKVPYPKKLNVWAAAGTHLKTQLYYFNQNMDSELYTKVLKKCLKEENLISSPKCPSRLRKNFVFLQDNATYHKNTKPMETLEDLVGNRWIEHPARSPDLNVMEDLWSYLDRKVKAARPKTIKSLKRILTQSWDALPWSYISKSTNSMSRRLAQCIEKKGERLDY
jgi:hypothetical protein